MCSALVIALRLVTCLGTQGPGFELLVLNLIHYQCLILKLFVSYLKSNYLVFVSSDNALLVFNPLHLKVVYGSLLALTCNILLCLALISCRTINK